MDNMEELNEMLATRLTTADKVLVFPVSDYVAVAGYYENGELIDSVIAILDNGSWEVIEGDNSRIASYSYLLFFSYFVDVVGDKVDIDQLLNNDLLR